MTGSQTHYLYLLINVATITIPLLRSFEPKIHYYKYFPALFKGIAITGALFIIWDIIFTQQEIWGFNQTYLTGIQIINLPIEEWLFFVTVPFASVFIYEVINYFSKKDHLGRLGILIARILSFLLVILAAVFYDRWYTLVTFILTASFLIFLTEVVKVNWLGKFFRAYLVILIPFFGVNGILTGTGIEDQVVWYNDLENMGFRIGTIPIEDSIYGMLLIIMTIYFLESSRSKQTINKSI